MSVIKYIGELDVEVSSVGDYRDLTLRWLQVMSRDGCPTGWSTLENGGTLQNGRGDAPDAPWGPPHAAWGRWATARVADHRDVDLTSEKPHGALRHSRRRLTARTFPRDLRVQLADPPWLVSVELCTLDEHGVPATSHGEPYEASATVDWDGDPAVVQLQVQLDDPRNTSDMRRDVRLAESMLSIADSVGVRFGFVGRYLRYGTELESAFPRVAFQAGSSTQANGQLLRGYSWVTVVPQELADGVRLRGDLYRVERLSSGGLWLQATLSPQDYTGPAIEGMWWAVAPLLPQGQPVDEYVEHMRRNGFPQHLIDQSKTDFALVMKPASEAV